MQFSMVQSKSICKNTLSLYTYQSVPVLVNKVISHYLNFHLFDYSYGSFIQQSGLCVYHVPTRMVGIRIQ